MEEKMEEKIEKLKKLIDYEKRKQEVCATSKEDLYYLEELEETLEELESEV